MSSPENAPETPELTPEAKHYIGRARRSFGFSVGLMLIGFIAVAGAIVYRVNRDAPPAPELTAISVPAGAEVVSVVPAGDGVYITYRVGARQGVRVVDAQTGAVLQDIELVDDAK